MTAASRGPNLFSIFSESDDLLYRTRREPFLFSVLGQAAILVVITYFTSCIVVRPPDGVHPLSNFSDRFLIFAGHYGGGGGGLDALPASHGNLPRASLATQIAPPAVILPKEMPKLPVEPTVVVAPEIKFAEGGQPGDPLSEISRWFSSGSGGPGGVGTGCCGGVGPSHGPGVGPGPSGIYPAGRMGVTLPEAIYSPEPSFSEEARKAKAQGVVLLLLVVGKDGHPYNIRLGQSLGMGLDEKAIEAVSRWRFRPATLNGQPVATQIAVQVDFHLY
jgi:periplasmic protein TonB